MCGSEINCTIQHCGKYDRHQGLPERVSLPVRSANIEHLCSFSTPILFPENNKITVFTGVIHALFFNQNFVSKFRVRDLCEETILRK
jgi:hypothetical protein